MKWIFSAALAVALAGQAEAQENVTPNQATGPLDLLPAASAALLESAVQAGMLLAWRDLCRPTDQARAGVNVGGFAMAQELAALPPEWQQYATGAILAARLSFTRAVVPCGVLAHAALDGALQDRRMEVPR